MLNFGGVLAIILPDTTLWWIITYNMTSWKNFTILKIGDTSSLLVHFLFASGSFTRGFCHVSSWKWMAKEVGRWLCLLLGRPGLVSAPKASPHLSVKPRTTTLSPKTVTIRAAHWWTFGWTNGGKMMGKTPWDRSLLIINPTKITWKYHVGIFTVLV